MLFVPAGLPRVSYEQIALRLDYGDGQFFNGDGSLFVCQTHGAMYHPKTGLCVEGPCAGASLHSLKIETLDGEIQLIDF